MQKQNAVASIGFYNNIIRYLIHFIHTKHANTILIFEYNYRLK